MAHGQQYGIDAPSLQPIIKQNQHAWHPAMQRNHQPSFQNSGNPDYRLFSLRPAVGKGFTLYF
jgi:hypothetical protein